MDKLNTSEIFPSVDIAKFVMAIWVVLIHTHPFHVIENEQLDDLFTRYSIVAVRYFFIASGFFLGLKLFKNGSDREVVLKKWLMHLLKLYIVWTLIYLPFAVYDHASRNDDFFFSAACYLRNVVFVGENYLSWPLWYLLALIWPGIILLVWEKLKLSHEILIVAAVLLPLVGRMFENYDVHLYFKVFLTTRNGLFVGFTYVVAGILLSQYGSMKIWQSVVIVVAGLSALYFEPFAALLVAVGLFSLTIKKTAPQGHIALRDSSTIIYFSHMIFVGLFLLCFPWPLDNMVLSAIVLVLCLLLSALLIRYASNTGVYRFLFK